MCCCATSCISITMTSSNCFQFYIFVYLRVSSERFRNGGGLFLERRQTQIRHSFTLNNDKMIYLQSLISEQMCSVCNYTKTTPTKIQCDTRLTVSFLQYVRCVCSATEILRICWFMHMNEPIFWYIYIFYDWIYSGFS